MTQEEIKAYAQRSNAELQEAWNSAINMNDADRIHEFASIIGRAQGMLTIIADECAQILEDQ